ncbi:MAG: hypothetical protein IKO72_01230 [Kiritimatiellae bacterium]|nr:hypothetical protein [Kiritimatiellia bacterium]
MRKTALILAALALPAVLHSEAWRPSDAEISAWNRIAAEKTGDCAFSPIGLAISVAMLGEGTTGVDRANIMESFGLLSDFGSTFSYVLKSYAESTASNAVSLTIAPSIWSRKIQKMETEYRHSLMRNFEAETGLLSTPLPINAWTEAKTDGRVTNVVGTIDHRTDVLLLNAIAFEGAWQTPFDASLTKKEPFHSADGGVRQVEMMHGEMEVQRLQDEKYTAVRVPFAVKGFSMLLLLPPKGVDVYSFRASFGKGISIDELKSRFRAASGEGFVSAQSASVRLRFAMPRIEMLSRWELTPIISMFKVPKKGYPRLGESATIDEVLQYAYVKVSETGYSLTPGARPPEPDKKDTRSRRARYYDDEDSKPAPAKESFSMDHPFVFMVWDANTDTIVIAGQFTGR